jgi:hypothetical protein
MIPPLFGKFDDRNLIFGHKLHIGMPYCGKRFWTRQIPTSCLPTLLIFIHIWTYMLIFRRIFLSNYWWQKSGIWSQSSYRYPILWEAFLDPSDSYFLFVGIWWVQKCFPQYGIPIWRLWPNIRFLPSTVTEKNVTKNILDGWKDRRTEVKQYTLSPFGERGYKNVNWYSDMEMDF